MLKKILLPAFILAFIFLGAGVQTSTNWSDFVSAEGDSWKTHFTDRHTVASIYGVSKRTTNSPSEFLERHHRLFGIDQLSNLKFSYKQKSDLGSHYFYQQYFGTLQVEGGGITIHFNRNNQIIAVNSSFQPGLKQASNRIGSVPTKASAGKLVILPLAGEARLARKIQVDSTSLQHGSWLLFVDAFRPNYILRVLRTDTAVTGEGRIYIENPVVTPDRTQQAFLYLHGTKLNGKYLKTFNANDHYDVNEFRFSDFTTAFNSQMRFNFGEKDPRLPEAMAYFHINRVHDQWKKVGMSVLDSKAPVFVNVAETEGGKGLDNAFYSRSNAFPNTGAYVFGSGDRFENLGLDADVYYHEYGHGVLDQTRPQFLEAFESTYPRSFHEGFGDISAAAITGNSRIGEFGLRVKETQQFVGRDLENNNRFPQNVIHPQLRRTEIHYAGLIVGGTWWDLQKSIGRDEAQRILFKALPIIPKELSFFDVRDAMMVTDSVLNQGRNQQAIQDAFAKHGISGNDPGQTGRMNVTALRPAFYDIKTGDVSLKNNFKQGAVIAILADYKAENVTPGYNMIPEWFDIKGPRFTRIFVFTFASEVVKGSHGGLKGGALQFLIETDSTTAKGTYEITTRARLGGTSHLGAKRRTTFTIN
jgi:Zn-dependent metalloprotease